MSNFMCHMNTPNFEVEENTYKHYYDLPLSEPEEDSMPSNSNKRVIDQSIDEFFEVPKKKKTKVHSSTVGRSTGDGMSYVSTNADDATNATHLIKIEIYDMKKLANVDPTEHWKNADIRLKYYIDKSNNTYHQRTRALIYSMTKEISNSTDSKKYSYKHKP